MTSPLLLLAAVLPLTPLAQAVTAPVLGALAQAGETAPRMTTSGWLFMGLAWVFVTSLLVWSFWRVLRTPKSS